MSGERTFLSWSTHFFSPWLFDPHPASEHPLIQISLWGEDLIQDSPHFRCTSLSRTISLLGMSMTTSGLSKVHFGEQPPATPFFSFVLYKFSILARQTITSINQINQIKRQEIAKNVQEYMKLYSNMDWSLQQIYSKTYCPEIMQLLFKINLLLKWVHNFTIAQI